MKFQGREVGIPWRRTERRQADVTALALQALQSQASTGGTTSTAAVEMASGLLARSLAAAKVSGPAYAVGAITPSFLAQVGRSLILRGESLHVIRVDQDGVVHLYPAAGWTMEGDYAPETWTIVADLPGPSRTTSIRTSYQGVIHLTWATAARSPHAGIGPLSGAGSTSRLNAEADRALADESSGPIANLLAVPDSASGENSDGDPAVDPLGALSGDIKNARGRALLMETTASGWGEGRSSAPKKDLVPSRLGPAPGAALVQLRADAQDAILSACGVGSSMFAPDAPGTAQREAMRRFHLTTLLSIARSLSAELSSKLEAAISLGFRFVLYRSGRPSQRLCSDGGRWDGRREGGSSLRRTRRG